MCLDTAVTHQAMRNVLHVLCECTDCMQDLTETDLHRELLLNTTKTQFNVEQAAGWLMCMLIGLAVAVLAFFFNW